MTSIEDGCLLTSICPIYIYKRNYENHLSSRLSSQWLCGNSCAWTNDVRLPQSLCGDNREQGEHIAILNKYIFAYIYTTPLRCTIMLFIFLCRKNIFSNSDILCPNCNHGHNIMIIFDVLPNFPFTTSKMKPDY